jgi:Ca-activated chloride channel family protein
VLINATVVDKEGRFIPDLAGDRFRVFDEGVEVPITSVAVEEVPISMVILLDISGSMKKKIMHAREAINRVLDRAGHGDEFCLLLFNDTVQMRYNFHTDTGIIRDRAAQAATGGGTALRDSLIAAVSRVRSARNARRAILLVSDGVDTASRYKWKDVESYLLEANAALYVLTEDNWSEDEIDSAWLRDLSKITGGRFFSARTKKFSDIVDRLAIRLQYVIAYVPQTNGSDRSFRKVKVRLRGRDARKPRVYWRRGYYANIEIK